MLRFCLYPVFKGVATGSQNVVNGMEPLNHALQAAAKLFSDESHCLWSFRYSIDVGLEDQLEDGFKKVGMPITKPLKGKIWATDERT